jgi:hypothetical protein
LVAAQGGEGGDFRHVGVSSRVCEVVGRIVGSKRSPLKFIPSFPQVSMEAGS